MNHMVAQGEPDALRVSVVIPLYNHESYIEAAINSVLSQTVPVTEIIVIDDGSADGSADKVRQLCQKHPQIIFWSWSNQGAHHTLNAGILRATGDFVAILNSDDCYASNRLAACLDVVRADPTVDVVASAVSFLDDKGNVLPNPWYDDALTFYKQEEDIALALLHANFLVTTSNLFIRRSVFASVGLFASLRYTHDLEYVLRLILGKKRIHFIDQPLLAYRLHTTNTISENKVKQDIERAVVFAFFLYRQWRDERTGEALSTALERYVGVLAQQDLLEIVTDFLRVLRSRPQAEAMSITGSLAYEFQEFLSGFGIDWVGQSNVDVLLAHFDAARKVHLRRRQELQQLEKLQSDIGALKDDIRWLQTQKQNLTVANEWLQSQRDEWERTAAEREQTIVNLQKQGQGLAAGKLWLEHQRDAWERACSDCRNAVATLQLQVQDLITAKSWLEDQRKAWQNSSMQRDHTIEELQASLQEVKQSLASLKESLASRELVLTRVRANLVVRLVNSLSGGRLLGHSE